MDFTKNYDSPIFIDEELASWIASIRQQLPGVDDLYFSPIAGLKYLLEDIQHSDEYLLEDIQHSVEPSMVHLHQLSQRFESNPFPALDTAAVSSLSYILRLHALYSKSTNLRHPYNDTYVAVTQSMLNAMPNTVNRLVGEGKIGPFRGLIEARNNIAIARGNERSVRPPEWWQQRARERGVEEGEFNLDTAVYSMPAIQGILRQNNLFNRASDNPEMSEFMAIRRNLQSELINMQRERSEEAMDLDDDFQEAYLSSKVENGSEKEAFVALVMLLIYAYSNEFKEYIMQFRRREALNREMRKIDQKLEALNLKQEKLNRWQRKIDQGQGSAGDQEALNRKQDELNYRRNDLDNERQDIEQELSYI